MDHQEAVPAPEAPPAIELRGLVRRFGRTLAVDGLSLAVPAGSFFGFLGPNGAGKTTTLRIVTGLLPPSAGEVRIHGSSMAADPVGTKRLLGAVPDDLALFDRLSFREHLDMVGPVYGLTRDETSRRAEDLLGLLGLLDARDVQAADASHGMRKKLALALALVHGPRVLCLDEPFEGIDPIAGRTIRDLLGALARKGTTVFLTSHILEIVESLCDRVAILDRGRLVAATTLGELRARGQSLSGLFAEATGAPPSGLPELPWLF